MTSKFFQGESVLAPVVASSAETFKDVVAKWNVCPQINMERKAFLALPKPVRQEKKRVPFFTAAAFKTSPSKRDQEHVSVCNLLFLDLDEEEDGKCPAAPFVNNPELLAQALQGFNFAAHTTVSSTPEKPRMRVVVEADAIPLESHNAAVRTIAALMGLKNITKESLIASQPMFFPTQFVDDTEDDHPVLISRTLARAFTVEDILEGIPDFYRRPARTDSGDGLDFLRAPLPEVTLAVAKEALAVIDPDCEYLKWFDVVCALRHQFHGEDTEKAYELFDDWSSTGEKYGGSDDTRRKWDSARPTPVGRAPVTIRTLLKRAVAAGWNDEKLKDSGYNAVIRWMENVDSVTELMEQGVHKILSTAQLSNSQISMLVERLKATAKERFSEKPSLEGIRKDMARLKAKMENNPEEKKPEPKWAKGLCFVTVPKEIYRPLTGEKYKPETFDLKYARYLLPTEKSLIAAGIPVNEVTLSRPLMKPTEYVLNSLKIDTFYDYAYAPNQPMEMLFVHEKRRYVNTYAPTYPQLEPELSEQAGELFQKHLCNLVAEPEYRRTLVDFMAYQVQHPGQKVRWAVLIQGAEGAGKTYLAEVMKAVLGRRHVKTVDGTTITSGWNEWTFGYQMVVIEEVRVVGTNKHDIMNRLKPWITNEDIPVNQKFRDSRDTQNITNYMLFSNHHNALALTPGDRRYYVVKSSLQTKEQVLALGKDYFTELFGFLTEHPGAMRAWLMDWTISPEFAPHGQAPRTSYVADLIQDSASDLTAAVRTLMLDGDHPLVQYDIVSSRQLLIMLQTEGDVRNVSPQHLANVLRDEGLRKLDNSTMIQGERHYLWARRDCTPGSVPDTARLRAEQGLKNLCMEMLF